MIVTAIIEARMKSTRLPGKNLRPILGRPMLEMLIERLKRSKLLDGIVVATTTDTSDDVIEVLCGKLGVGCFRGSMEDVLDRVLRAAQSNDADVIVEITGDCPLTDPGIVDQAVEFFLENKYDYVSNFESAQPRPQHGTPSYYPRRAADGSRIDPDRPLAKQFDLLRVADPHRFPAFFELRGQRYKLTITKADREESPPHEEE